MLLLNLLLVLLYLTYLGGRGRGEGAHWEVEKQDGDGAASGAAGPGILPAWGGGRRLQQLGQATTRPSAVDPLDFQPSASRATVSRPCCQSSSMARAATNGSPARMAAAAGASWRKVGAAVRSGGGWSASEGRAAARGRRRRDCAGGEIGRGGVGLKLGAQRRERGFFPGSNAISVVWVGRRQRN
jgi:hypothetical protein